MILKQAMLLGAAVALSSSPAWALPGGKHGPHSPAGQPVAKGNPHGMESHSKGAKGPGGADEGNGKGKGKGGKPGNPKSHRCVPRAVGYVASGILVSDTLVEGAHHTFSGEVTVEVKHGNRHARGETGSTKTYKVEGVRLTLVVPDRDEDHVVGVDDLAPGDRVRLIGDVTTLAKKCAVGEFTPQLTVEKIVFHGPRR